jgi:hypothetical protein
MQRMLVVFNRSAPPGTNGGNGGSRGWDQRGMMSGQTARPDLAGIPREVKTSGELLGLLCP